MEVFVKILIFIGSVVGGFLIPSMAIVKLIYGVDPITKLLSEIVREKDEKVPWTVCVVSAKAWVVMEIVGEEGIEIGDGKLMMINPWGWVGVANPPLIEYVTKSESTI